MGESRAAEPAAGFGGLVATGLEEVSASPAVLDGAGRWAVAMSFEGAITCARFATWLPESPSAVAGAWAGPHPAAYRSSMSRGEYVAAVEQVREAIARGDVYQANVCRTLTADLSEPRAADPAALAQMLRQGNPAPFAGFLRLPDHRVSLATASPELFLRRSGDVVWSGPIKGTGARASDMGEKDQAENVMIVDLVRNDLSRVAEPGSVEVCDLLTVEQHPGLAHLVSRVRARLVEGTTWPELLAATFPPGSVTGAPKHAAQEIIRRLEPIPRGPYCGAIGWVDADRGEAELAVAIRTFWVADDELRFGTGAGITWGSDAAAEWEETALKARTLVGVARGAWP